jgi:hypothetical protein
MHAGEETVFQYEGAELLEAIPFDEEQGQFDWARYQEYSFTGHPI